LHNLRSWNPYSTVVSGSEKVEVRGVEPVCRLSNRKGSGLFFLRSGGSVAVRFFEAIGTAVFRLLTDRS
jgi:hypothetical protein